MSTGRDITDRRTEQALRRLNSELNEAGRIAALLDDEAGQFHAFAHIRWGEPLRRCAIATSSTELDRR